MIQEEILPFAEVVKPKRRLRIVRRDPSDNRFLECALAGKASVIAAVHFVAAAALVAWRWRQYQPPVPPAPQR